MFLISVVEETSPKTYRRLGAKELLAVVTWKSQFIQDRWVAEPLFKGMTGGFFVDIGAHDGVWLSNTYALEKSFGWTGIQIATNRYA